MTPTNTRARARMRGASFVEVMFALAIVAVATMVQIQQVTITLREHSIDLETQFAFRKASGMLAELQASVDQGAIGSTIALDAVANSDPSPFLTTRSVTAPDHIMSGNVSDADGAWRWFRAIDVEPVEGSDRSRYVRIRLLRADDAGRRTVTAVASGILNLTIRAEPFVQTYDVYALAIAEAPSLWQPLPALRAQLQSIAGEVVGANPNLRFNIHWISKLGYGRDPLYVPYVNESAPADSAAPWVYWYPGKLAASDGASTLYSAEMISGRVRTEAGVMHDFDAADNPYPHAVADRFNHCLRTPEARALFDLRVAAGVEKADEPPLQLLLADMAEQPERFRNAILVNLHGDGLPFPPLRNYADAAKDPAGRPGVRVVTHPARLHTPSNSGRPMEFRVYAYKTDPNAGDGLLQEPVTLQIFGGDFRATLQVERQAGGVDIKTGDVNGCSSIDGAYSFGPAAKSTAAHAAFEMHYEVGYATMPAPHTWVRFYNTPLTCPQVGGRGIDPDAWLYGTDYTPSPVTDLGGFYAMSNVSLLATPKNTVRWRVEIPAAALTNVFGSGAMITATTRIGCDMSTGVMWPTPYQPLNKSTTYAWWTPCPQDVPITERYQILGDPRHNPYIDLCAAGDSFPHGYNWWFDDLRDGLCNVGSQWTCLDNGRLRDGFGRGVVEDVPRIMQTWRDALQGCGAVFVNPTGRIAGKLLMGGEIVLPETSVTVHASLYGGCGTLALNDVEPPDPQGPIWSLALPMDELSGFFGGGTTDSEATAGRPVVCSGCGFFSKPWLGELVPDADFGCYQSNGNLATADGFARAARSALAFPDLPRGSNWAYPSGSALDDLGGSSLLQTGGTAGCFVQGVNSGPAAALTDELSAITRAVGLAAPAVGATQFAFSLNGTPSMPLEQRAYQDLFPDQDATLFEAFTTTEAAGNMGAGAIRIGAPGTCKAAYFVPIGDVARSGEEHRAAAFKSLAFGLRTLFVASEPDRQDGVTPPPIVSIALPTPKQVVQRPDAIEIRWGTDFKRFDEQRYTTRFAADWRGAEASLVYVVTYRQVDDPQWHHAFDGVPIEPGVRPVDPTRWLQDTGDGKESYLVATPTSRFPAGDYVLRVDCFRREGALHGAHHEVFVEVKR